MEKQRMLAHPRSPHAILLCLSHASDDLMAVQQWDQTARTPAARRIHALIPSVDPPPWEHERLHEGHGVQKSNGTPGRSWQFGNPKS